MDDPLYDKSNKTISDISISENNVDCKRCNNFNCRAKFILLIQICSFVYVIMIN